jgi:hypothetical protein
MVIELATSAVNRGFEQQSGQAKDHQFSACWFAEKTGNTKG